MIGVAHTWPVTIEAGPLDRASRDTHRGDRAIYSLSEMTGRHEVENTRGVPSS